MNRLVTVRREPSDTAFRTVEERRFERRADAAIRCGLLAPVVAFAHGGKKQLTGAEARIIFSTLLRRWKRRSSTDVPSFVTVVTAFV